jgi:Mrp family chromosome partitioning ATPase/capsular polysaccharide biosynthesis protein
LNPRSATTSPAPDDEGAARPLLKAVRTHRLLVALATAAALLGAIAYLAVRSPSYEAEATILVTPLPQDDQTFLGLGLLRESGDATRTTQTAAALLDTPEAAADTAAAMGADWTEKNVRDRVEVAPEGGSNIIIITATSDDAAEAAKLATEYANATLANRSRALNKGIEAAITRIEAELAALDPADPNAAVLSGRLSQLQSISETGDPTLTLQQEALVPTSPSNPGPLIVLPLALIAGLALGAGGALIRELTDRRLADTEDLIAVYPLPVLANVPDVPKKDLRGPEGSSWYLPPEVHEAFLTLALQLEQRQRPLRSVMITSPTRSDGKTSSAINFAVTLAAMGRRVALLDFDLRKPGVGAALGLDVAWSQADLIDPYRSLPQMLVRTKLPTLEVLPVQASSGDTATSEMVSRLLPQFVQQAQAIADHVIVDTPPLGEVSDALRLAAVVDDILVVARAGSTERGHLEGLRDMLERVGQTPEGYIVIGAPDRADRGYGYGYGHRGAPARTGFVLGDSDAALRSPPPSANGSPDGEQVAAPPTS